MSERTLLPLSYVPLPGTEKRTQYLSVNAIWKTTTFNNYAPRYVDERDSNAELWEMRRVIVFLR